MSVLALEMYRSMPRHVAGRALGGRAPAQLAPLRLVTRDEPSSRRPGWARLRPLLSGICGSDLGALSGRTSLYFSALVSMPFVPGHEVVAELLDDCDDLAAGTRVVVDPVLTCAARGVDPCEACETGRTNRCERITVGHLKPGLQTGFCADTGGGWGQVLDAHRSQLHPVADDMPDEQAVLTEPTACAVHTALQARVPDNGRVLVSGAGVVGLARHPRAARAHPGRRDHRRRQASAPAPARQAVRRERGRRAEGGAAPGPPGDRRVPGAAGVRLALPARRGGRRGRRGRQPCVRRDDVARDQSRRPGGARRHAGDRPTSPRRGSASSRSPARTRPRSARAPASPRSTSPARLVRGDAVQGLAQSIARYPLYRWREALDHASGAGGLGTVKVAFDPRSSR